ncbi:DUF502 domain-containing protein [uncultured Mucilaginibacter sp.]|uniref:DUF502 domain-containing protein n=1 Tax=uncultured Mucilaginibacter sp. TaxID=797541 RepID=UPI0025EB4519|nr:DUF502 domain-containing protein [uncultured Mucilaginibacter sp.]
MNRIFRALANYFIKGLLIVAPIGIAGFLIYWAVTTVDNALNVSSFFIIDQKTGKHMSIPGLGILTVVVFLLLAGVIVTNVITAPIKQWANRWINRLPLFKFLHSSIKDLTEAFVGDEKKFNEPVLVEVNEFGLMKIGFITQKDLTAIGLPGHVSVYLPASYSISGIVVIVSADKVKPIESKSAADMMKFAISGGVSGI